MIKHSKEFVTNLDDISIQPNAVDLRVSTIHEITGTNPIQISESKPKEFVERKLIFPDSDGTYTLRSGGLYDISSQHRVNMPNGYAGWLIIRSTLGRNGCILVNGLYDSGYSGVVGGIIHNLSNSDIKIDSNVRFAQFVMVLADTENMYQGFYNKEAM